MRASSVKTKQISYCAPDDLTPAPGNARRHTRVQVRAIAKSIEAFGFNAPISVDEDHRILAGHGRWEASKLLGLERIPIFQLSNLTEAQAKAYALADNKLSDRSSWNDEALAAQ
jgi:ParB-like chromosome segregation protein Spo0J